MNCQFSKADSFSKIPEISHGFFGRYFEENSRVRDFNCSRYVGDDENHVNNNLQTVKRCLLSEKIITLKQIHGSKCLIVDNSSESDREADAFVTKVPKIALGILTADCTPILFVDPAEKIIGASHAGWKGAVSGVIESTVEKMISLGASEKNIKACLGPAISGKNYSVGDDFLKNFESYSEKLSDLDECFIKKEDRFYFDIPKFCIKILSYCGIAKNNIERIAEDTFDNIDKFFSYRYEQRNPSAKPGRNISAISLK